MKKFLITVLIVPVALGCDCKTLSLEEARNFADAVFVGQIRKITYFDDEKDWPAPRLVVELKVERYWKGRVQKNFTLHTQVSHSACEGLWKRPRVNDRMLIFAKKIPGRWWQRFGKPENLPEQVYSTTACPGRTQVYEGPWAQEDVAKLGQGKTP